jgi:hypothetical protein
MPEFLMWYSIIDWLLGCLLSSGKYFMHIQVKNKFNKWGSNGTTGAMTFDCHWHGIWEGEKGQPEQWLLTATDMVFGRDGAMTFDCHWHGIWEGVMGQPEQWLLTATDMVFGQPQQW